jgi:hypothetical protein
MKERIPEIDIESRKAIVCSWLEQNIEYSRTQVKRAVANRDGDKVRDWETWRSFSEHALGEVQSGMLDLWLSNMENPKFDPTLVDDSDTTFGEA